AVHPNTARDARFDPMLAWHNPDPEWGFAPVDGIVNVMSAPWFTQGQYRSDSNQRWREGCPHDELRAGSLEWLQLLVHPVIWIHEGATMRETMEALLAAKRGEWLEQLANDRIDLS
ncbi:MAG: hypothetical protein ACYDCH_15200, partial [Gaiellaceae bacterium]